MDRADILTTILNRNALRREARLPPLDVRSEYQRAVEQAHWRVVFDEHYATVRAEVVDHLRQTRGRDYRLSVGGRCLIEAIAHRKLQERYGEGTSGAGLRLGYAPLDAVLVL